MGRIHPDGRPWRENQRRTLRATCDNCGCWDTKDDTVLKEFIPYLKKRKWIILYKGKTNQITLCGTPCYDEWKKKMEWLNIKVRNRRKEHGN